MTLIITVSRIFITYFERFCLWFSTTVTECVQFVRLTEKAAMLVGTPSGSSRLIGEDVKNGGLRSNCMRSPEFDFISPDRHARAGPHAWIVYVTTLCLRLGWGAKLCLLQIFCTSGPCNNNDFDLFSQIQIGRMLRIHGFLSWNPFNRLCFLRIDRSKQCQLRICNIQRAIESCVCLNGF